MSLDEGIRGGHLISTSTIHLIRHRAGALGLRLGFGPWMQPVDGLRQLQELFDAHTFWAVGRTSRELRRMLQRSQVVVTAWGPSKSWSQPPKLLGFGRATSDGVFRAVLWDVVVAPEAQGKGLGRRIVTTLLADPAVAAAERTYLMTSQSCEFYRVLGFEAVAGQQLMLKAASRLQSSSL